LCSKGLESCTKLEELSVENNYLKTIENLDQFQMLRKLNLSNNEIYYDGTDADNIELNLQKLNYLSLNNNKIKSLKFLQKLPSLLELYSNFNDIANIREIFHLKQMLNLVIMDLWCNPMCDDQKYRLFIIYHLKSLKSLDGYPIEQAECIEAKDLFGGKLTCDFIAEKFANIQLNELRSLDLPQCSIRYVDFGSPQITAQLFENLHFLNLENNSLTSFSGLIYLKNLKTLCLNYNKIEGIFPKNRSMGIVNTGANGHQLPPVMESLEVLHLGYNGIADLAFLQLGRLVSLKALFLQGKYLRRDRY
jgi:Leucine-rich repeat (LRR) protein